MQILTTKERLQAGSGHSAYKTIEKAFSYGEDTPDILKEMHMNLGSV
jgi:hypothetical protein